MDPGAMTASDLAEDALRDEDETADEPASIVGRDVSFEVRGKEEERTHYFQKTPI